MSTSSARIARDLARFSLRDFEKEWKPSIEFLELYEGEDRERLLEEIRSHRECPLALESDKLPTDPILINLWPIGFVPRELLLVDSKGKIPSGKKKPKSK